MSTIVAQESLTFRPLPPLPPEWLSLAHAFIHTARTHPSAPALADTTGAKLNYHQTLRMSLAIANILKKDIGSPQYVGILLPPSAAAALANIALTLLGKVPVNLNYTSSQKLFDSCINQSGIEQIITSKKILERFPFQSKAAFVKMDDLEERATLLIKAKTWFEAELLPENLLGLFMKGLEKGNGGNRLDEPATVIFTAGSTGDPKGVVLSHRNILSNLLAIKIHKHSTDDEVVMGIAPFFHAFGFTTALWTVLALGYKGIYHHDPFDAQTIGKLCQDHKVTIMFCTPTMMRAYARRCKPEQFKTMRFFVAGGEKLKAQLAEEIERQLGVIPLEGYGLTETSPVISSTLHGDIALPGGRTMHGRKQGTVGIPIPGTEVKIVDLDTDRDLPPGREGMILVRGPQIMQGYLNKPEETAKVKRGDWFVTCDLGFIDQEGFLTITGRLSQFSKIGGEMVPHLAVEKEILRVSGSSEQNLSVTSVADYKRGERLAVVYTDLAMTPQEVVKRLHEAEMSKLWIPDANDFIHVDELPVLGTGKIDLRKIKEIAARAVAQNK